jgi:hypothetical protein
VLGLTCRGIPKGEPASLRKCLVLLRPDSPDGLGKGQEVVDPDGQVRDDLRCSPMRTRSERLISSAYNLRLQAAPDLPVAPGDRADEPSHGRRVHANCRISLASAEHGHIHVARAYLLDEYPRPQTLATGHVLAGGDHQPARRLSRPEGRVGPHTPAARAVTLGAQQAIRIAVEALYVARRSCGSEVIDNEHRILRRERHCLQEICG